MDRDALVNAGIDYEQGINRFAGKVPLYEKYLKRMLEDDSIEKLEEQLSQKDYVSAFKTAHSLKGMSGNLSLNQFYKVICEIVEQLRDGEPGEEIFTSYQHAKTLYMTAKEAIRKEVAKEEADNQ